IFIIGFFTPVMLCAQQKDTLPEVKVFGQEAVDISKTTVPVQQLNKKELAQINSLSVADAVKYFSGVLIKDYGGIGGLKTISVRSLGANHTGVMYDGMMVGDAQGGQIDLGRFSLDNIESIQLSVSRPENNLLPARAYANGAVLSLTSGNHNIQKRSLAIKLKGGSFGFFNPSFLIKDRVSKRFSHSLSAEYQTAEGDYPYKNYVAANADSKRLNSDIKTYKAEYDAAYSINDSNSLKLKLYYCNSKRGLPGAVIFYNNFSNQRLDNELFFSQASWRKSISAKSRILFNAKFTKDYKYYIDPSYLNTAGKLENEFHQQEIYFSGAYSYKFSKALAVSYSSDYFNSKLKRTDMFAADFANPERNNFLNNIAIDFSKGKLNANANILHTFLNEKVQNGTTGRKLNEFTPAVAASYHISAPLYVRAFYKRIFRAPSFDDLYFANVGNTALRPEFVNQYNLGFTYNKKLPSIVESLTITTDAYYNNVKDKILAVPRQNLFQWTMLNIGKVEIKGIDVNILSRWKQWNAILFTTRLSYTYQDAKDVSNPSSPLYKKQIPYTPEHSGAVGMNIGYKNFDFSYNVLLSSYRYRLGDQIPENLAKEWATQDITLSYTLKSKAKNNYRITVELNNIFNRQYEVIKQYPMPRFNYRIGIIATFNQL
ncbi:MAG: TonB-dependent receptor, partial [Sphingobacteriales bacterium]